MVAFQHIKWPGLPPVSYLLKNGKEIQQMITELKIKPVSQTELPGTRVMINPQPLPPKAYLSNAADWWFKWGGMKIPHFHFDGDVYLLNEEQWQTFSSGVLKDFSKKLTNAKNISFSQLADIADAVEELR
jgi:hypothetical protein